MEASNGAIAEKTEFQGIVKLIRFCDLETVSQIRIPSKKVNCVDWDASSLRLAIGTEETVFLACLRLSYRHYILRDGTITFSMGSSIVKQSSQIVAQTSALQTQRDECIIFYN